MSSSKNSSSTNRLNQVSQWLGNHFDGVIIFDECHKGKNYSALNQSEGSRTAECFAKFQNKFPNARIVYCSATGLGDLKNLAYMTRLALWGPGTPFDGFRSFYQAFNRKKLDVLELLAVSMRQSGLFLSRQLSYEGADFEVVVENLSESDKAEYDKYVDIWQRCYSVLHGAMTDYDIFQSRLAEIKSILHITDREKEESLDEPDFDSQPQKSRYNRINAMFGTSAQQFFKTITVSLKVPKAIELTHKSLEQGYCVVIGLQSTGEARTKSMMEESTECSGFVSAPRGILRNLIDNYYPLPELPQGLQIAYERKFNLDTIQFLNQPRTTRQQSHMKTTSLDGESVSSLEATVDSSFSYDEAENENWDNLIDEVVCYKCQLKENDEKTLVCDRCNSVGCHIYCLDPPLNEVPESDWYCIGCQKIVDGENRMRDEFLDYYSEQLKQSTVKKEKFIAEIESMKFPLNPLDELIDSLGGPSSVAEMTGRSKRLICKRNIENGIETPKYEYENRNIDESLEGCTNDQVNRKERELFMNGKKLIAIISEAASAGISLHADRRVINQRRRVHITIELAWSAEKAIQQLGRTHRSNQSSAPMYKLLLTDIGGEKRFLTSIVTRLKLMGALTQGDRYAVNSFNFGEMNLKPELANKVVTIFYKLLMKNEVSKYDKRTDRERSDLKELLLKLRINTNEKNMGIELFLNRLLLVHIDEQTKIMEYLNYLMDSIATNTSSSQLDDSISEIHGDITTKKDSIRLCTINNINSYLYTYEINGGMNYSDIKAITSNTSGEDDGFYKSKREWNKRTMYLYAIQCKDPDEIDRLKEKYLLKGKIFKIYRPNSGLIKTPYTLEKLRSLYSKCREDNIEKKWEDEYIRSGTKCIHDGFCRNQDNCQVGRRCRNVYLVVGNLITIYQIIVNAINDPSDLTTKQKEEHIRIVRIFPKDTDVTIGIRVPFNAIDSIKGKLKLFEDSNSFTNVPSIYNSDSEVNSVDNVTISSVKDKGTKKKRKRTTRGASKGKTKIPKTEDYDLDED